MKTWKDIRVGDVVRVPAGTRRGPSTFAVTEVEPDGYWKDATRVLGLTTGPKPSWVWFSKSNGFTAFSVKGEGEFDDEE